MSDHFEEHFKTLQEKEDERFEREIEAMDATTFGLVAFCVVLAAIFSIFGAAAIYAF